MISDKNLKIKDKNKLLIIKKLAECSGHTGIAGGQELDLKFEKRKNFKDTINMQRKKNRKIIQLLLFFG